MVYQLAGKTKFFGDLWQFVAMKPASCRQFLFLQAQTSAFVACSEANHQTNGVGPRLTAKVARTLYFQSCFFSHFPYYGLFERLACLYEACYQTVEVTFKVLGMYQQNLVSLMYQHNDGCS